MNTILHLLKNKSVFLIGFLCLIGFHAMAQWKPAMEGINPNHGGDPGTDFHLEFKPNGPLGKDWVYGGYFDEDSLRRCVAYREGGRWKPLPFSGYKTSKASDIGMYGDTLYILGSFGNIILDKDSSSLPNTGILKWHQDSLWATPNTVVTGSKSVMAVKNDSLLIWGGSYYNPPTIIYTQFMTTDGGANWQYPYSIIHPTDNTANFGAHPRLEILSNGDILTLNNGSNGNSGFKGINRWDGSQWHGFGTETYGSSSRVFDFEFYKGELYMGGTFNTYDFPDDPANFIGRWDGTEWQDLATGVNGFNRDLFVHDSILYAIIGGGDVNQHLFGDANIPIFAGWDGHQWCGTPFNYSPIPATFGFVNDTLYATFYYKGTAGADSVTYMNYYDGDYLHGPNSICSTLGLGEKGIKINKKTLEIYPNPAQDEITLSFKQEAITSVEILDISGKSRLIWKEKNGRERISLNISHLAPGFYVLNVNHEHYVRFIKK